MRYPRFLPASLVFLLPFFITDLALAAPADKTRLQSEKTPMKSVFVFQPQAAKEYPEARLVNANQTYSDASGYGFDLGSRYDQSNRPFYFSVQVPEGNYRVSVELGHPDKASKNTVKAESRRLYLQDVTTAAGEFSRQSFIVNIRTAALTAPEQNAPGGHAVVLNAREKDALHWDHKLTLEFNGEAPQLRSLTLEKTDVPVIWLVGDSTVTDQSWEPAASWGQMLPRFFDVRIAIANHAESGETLKSFISGLRLAKVLENLREGDYLFIQFGHNDQKKNWPQTWADATTTYPAYLQVLIAEARLRGATPVLITSMQRRQFDARGKIKNSHGDYPRAVRDLAAREGVALIDLESMSVTLYEALGVEDAPLAFNDNGRDATHHNNYGALQLAKCVVRGIRLADLPLSEYLLPGSDHYDPAHPDPVKTFSFSASPRSSAVRPAGN